MGYPARHLTAAPLVTVRPNTAQRCHSEPVRRLAWESVLPFTPTGGQRPPPTFAASRQRRDLIIAQPPEGVSKEGGPQPSLFGRFKDGGFSRGKGNRNPFPLEWRSLVTFFRQRKKVTRRRQKKGNGKPSGGAEPRPYARLPKAHASSPCHSEPVTDVTGVGIRSPFHANRRPLAATYLCRFAAKARFDNRPPPRRVFPKREARTDRKPSKRKIV